MTYLAANGWTRFASLIEALLTITGRSWSTGRDGAALPLAFPHTADSVRTSLRKRSHHNS